MDLKSTLGVSNEMDVSSEPGVVSGMTVKQLCGVKGRPSERITVRSATFKPGTLEHLHWHLIEVFYYVISGRAIMRDIEGRTYNVGPGSVVYAPAGIAGSHEWEVIEELRLIAVRATTDPERTIQFTVDGKTMESDIEFDFLMRRGGGEFKKSLY